MKLNIKLISLLLILCFVSVSAVCADDTAGQIDDNTDENINVTVDDSSADTGNNNENNMGNLGTNNPTIEPKGFYELQQQIWKSGEGDTIELDSDYVQDGKRNWISIDRTITLEGNGHTLDGNHSAIFYITGVQNVVIKNTVFINGEII